MKTLFTGVLYPARVLYLALKQLYRTGFEWRFYRVWFKREPFLPPFLSCARNYYSKRAHCFAKQVRH
jgi:hypothetical protein